MFGHEGKNRLVPVKGPASELLSGMTLAAAARVLGVGSADDVGQRVTGDEVGTVLLYQKEPTDKRINTNIRLEYGASLCGPVIATTVADLRTHEREDNDDTPVKEV